MQSSAVQCIAAPSDQIKAKSKGRQKEEKQK
jgi:hypothetical protein